MIDLDEIERPGVDKKILKSLYSGDRNNSPRSTDCDALSRLMMAALSTTPPVVPFLIDLVDRLNSAEKRADEICQKTVRLEKALKDLLASFYGGTVLYEYDEIGSHRRAIETARKALEDG